MVNEWLNWTYIDFGSKLKISALIFNAYMHAAYVYLCKIYGVGGGGMRGGGMLNKNPVGSDDARNRIC